MNENELRELFKATNTSEPLSEGWPGLLRFGLAVAAAEREDCAKICDERKWRGEPLNFAEYCAEEIRMRSN